MTPTSTPHQIRESRSSSDRRSRIESAADRSSDETVKPLLACGLALFVTLPALGQSRSSNRWVASWATALVARPVGQGPGGRGQGPAAPAAQPAAPAAAPGSAPATPAPPSGPPTAAPAAPAPPGGGRGGFPPPVTITNQTIRQVVRVSVGGNRVRVVLSNAFGTAPVDIGAASRRPARPRLDGEALDR